MAVNASDVTAWSTRGTNVVPKPTTTTPTVFIVDNDWAVVTDIGRTMRANGLQVRTWKSGAEFLRAYSAQMPGCLVTDPCAEGVSGLDLQRELFARGIDTPIVFVTHQVDMRTTVLGMRAGAVTFLPKPVQAAELLSAVSEAIARDAANRAQHREHNIVRARLAQLTPREHEVLQLLMVGMMNKQIAAQLGMGEKTVKVHRGRILEKMEVRTALALVSVLHRANLQRSVSANCADA